LPKTAPETSSLNEFNRNTTIVLHSLICILMSEENKGETLKRSVKAFITSFTDYDIEETFNELYSHAINIYKMYDCVSDSLNALKEISNAKIKHQCFTVATKAAQSSGEISNEKLELLRHMHQVLEIDSPFTLKNYKKNHALSKARRVA